MTIVHFHNVYRTDHGLALTSNHYYLSLESNVF